MGNGGDIFSEEVLQIKVMCFENEPIIAIFSNETTGTPISWKIESTVFYFTQNMILEHQAVVGLRKSCDPNQT